MNPRGVVGGLILALLLVGCVPKVTVKRWAKDPGKPVQAADPNEYARLWVYSAPAGPPAIEADPGFTLRNLSERGQAAYIKAAAELAGSPERFQDALGRSLGGGGRAGTGSELPMESQDWTRFDRILVVSVSRNMERPLDRLMATRVTIRPTGGYAFTGYSVVASEFQTLNLEDLTRTTENTLDGTLSPALTGTVAGSMALKAGTSRKLEEKTTLSQQRENLRIDVGDDNLEIYRESDRGFDLAGKLLVKVTLAVDPAKPPPGVRITRDIRVKSGRFFEHGKPVPPGDVHPALAYLTAAHGLKLEAKATLEFLIRQVDQGGETYDESDDAVTLVHGSIRDQPCTILSGRESRRNLWLLMANPAGSAIQIDLKNGEGGTLVFSDFRTATIMADWMNRQKPANLGAAGWPLTLGLGSMGIGKDQTIEVRPCDEEAGAPPSPAGGTR